MSVAREAVFCRDTLWRDTIRVSTNVVAEEFVAHGWRCAWVTSPVTLTRAWRGGAMRRRRTLWREGGEQNGPVLEYAPATPLTWSWRPCLRSPWLGRNALALAVPSIEHVLRRHDYRERPDVLWIGTLGMASAINAIRAERTAYHAHDLFMDYPGAPAQLRQLERWLIDRVDGVFTTSTQVQQALIERYGVDERKIHMLGHGVHVDQYQPGPEPAELAAIPHPRAVLLGTLAQAEPALVRALFTRRPDAHLICIGPGGEPLAALGLPNVHVLGPRAHDTVAPYLMHADVGLILYPFALASNRLAGCRPMKLFEYAAAGLTVVSTWLAEYERMDVPVLSARDADGLAAAFDEALATFPARRDTMRAWAERHSWNAKYRFICERLGL